MISKNSQLCVFCALYVSHSMGYVLVRRSIDYILSKLNELISILNRMKHTLYQNTCRMIKIAGYWCDTVCFIWLNSLFIPWLEI